ncbi:site-2 protease family protein [Synechocystis sp. LKSZ1]|uniref:site-2 protease family protein n=1 Tax=Synechocystis sp. LKSZ1 TaxID=3144951 RepID=UPI00336C03B5
MTLNSPEIATIGLILLLAAGVLVWGFQRAKPYGRLGLLAWLQSLILMAPWLIFFALFALGLYLNLVTILVLLLISTGSYIWLGRKLRQEGLEKLLQEKANQRLQTVNSDQETVPSDQGTNLAPTPIPTDDLAAIKGIFGIDSFFATETIAYQDGAIFRGNLRTDPEQAYAKLAEKLKECAGNRYQVFLVEGTDGRPVVVVLPSSNRPQPMTLPQKNLAVVLFIATLVTSGEAAASLLGFDFFAQWQRYAEILPLVLGLASILLAHEVGHYLVAKQWQVGLSWPFFLPTWQIGSFGAITRFESLLPNRSALFDIALAGPACGGLLSMVFLVLGLLLSQPGGLLQIPSQFFQGSLLVGALARIILGEQLQQGLVAIHPLVVLGWLGLTITALNLLPAGQLDGGRLVQAIYGRKTARRTTIGTLILLGIVALVNPANPIPLYWAVVILFLQRELERPSLNELSEPDDTRAAWGLLALFLMLTMLIPLSPGLADRLGIGA